MALTISSVSSTRSATNGPRANVPARLVPSCLRGNPGTSEQSRARGNARERPPSAGRITTKALVESTKAQSRPVVAASPLTHWPTSRLLHLTDNRGNGGGPRSITPPGSPSRSRIDRDTSGTNGASSIAPRAPQRADPTELAAAAARSVFASRHGAAASSARFPASSTSMIAPAASSTRNAASAASMRAGSAAMSAARADLGMQMLARDHRRAGARASRSDGRGCRADRRDRDRARASTAGMRDVGIDRACGSCARSTSATHRRHTRRRTGRPRPTCRTSRSSCHRP